MIENLPDIFWNGAEGKVVQPQFKGKYGVELIVQTEWANDHPVRLDFPPEYRDQIKLYHGTQFDGQTWTMPQQSGPRVAAVVSSSDDLESCISEAVEIAGKIKGFKLQDLSKSVTQLRETLDKSREFGILM